jgi:type I restriction enzyme, R subunit
MPLTTSRRKSLSTTNVFPTEEELYNRYLAFKNYTSDELNIIETPFYYDAHSHEPRYYQRIAVDRTVEAIARGQQRVLVVMATGTGKTFTAFQIIHRLHKSGAKKKILYLEAILVLASFK